MTCSHDKSKLITNYWLIDLTTSLPSVFTLFSLCGFFNLISVLLECSFKPLCWMWPWLLQSSGGHEGSQGETALHSLHLSWHCHQEAWLSCYCRLWPCFPSIWPGVQTIYRNNKHGCMQAAAGRATCRVQYCSTGERERVWLTWHHEFVSVP